MAAATPVAGAHAATAQGQSCARAGAHARAAEARMVGLVNTVRRRAGQRPLARSPWLVRVARQRTGQIAARQRLQHEFRGGRLSWAPPARWAGENLAIATTPRSALIAMLRSPTHRNVLLFGRWQSLGVGARIACNGQVIYALDFLG
jgi:uncharacterized protein YkwD